MTVPSGRTVCEGRRLQKPVALPGEQKPFTVTVASIGSRCDIHEPYQRVIGIAKLVTVTAFLVGRPALVEAHFKV